MGKYWKLIGIVLAVAVFAGVMVAAVPGVKPDQGGAEPQLFTLLDNVEVPPGDFLFFKASPIESHYLDVSGFSKFKVFSRTTSPPESGVTGKGIFFQFTESMDGLTDTGGGGLLSQSNSGFTEPVDSSFVLPNPLPIRYLKVSVFSHPAAENHNLSVFLYAVP